LDLNLKLTHSSVPLNKERKKKAKNHDQMKAQM